MKQILTTYLNHSRVRFLEQTSTCTGVIWGIIVVTRVGIRTHDPEVARQTPYPLGSRHLVCRDKLWPHLSNYFFPFFTILSMTKPARLLSFGRFLLQHGVHSNLSLTADSDRSWGICHIVGHMHYCAEMWPKKVVEIGITPPPPPKKKKQQKKTKQTNK